MASMRWNRLVPTTVLGLAAFSVLVAACETPPVRDTATPPLPPPASPARKFRSDSCYSEPASDYCTDDYDCEPYKCDGSVHIYCSKQTDCAYPRRCIGGRCRSRCRTSCYSNYQCSTGNVCLAGRCQRPGNCHACNSSSDCQRGFECTSNECKVRERCSADFDCPDGYGCDDRRCRMEGIYGSCKTDSHCGANERCVRTAGAAGRCGTPRRCRKDADCSQGYECVASSCVVAYGPGCREDAQCPDGYICTDIGCTRRGVHELCGIDAHCGAGRKCKYGHCRDALDDG